MIRSILLFIIFISMFGALQAQENKDFQLVDITVNLKGDIPAKGKVRLMVFDSEANWLSKELRILTMDATEDANYVFEIKGLPAGTYAISVIHDENNNGELDMGMMGPEEGYGFSNNVRGTFGPAPFHKAAMTISENTKTTIEIY